MSLLRENQLHPTRGSLAWVKILQWFFDKLAEDPATTAHLTTHLAFKSFIESMLDTLVNREDTASDDEATFLLSSWARLVNLSCFVPKMLGLFVNTYSDNPAKRVLGSTLMNVLASERTQFEVVSVLDTEITCEGMSNMSVMTHLMRINNAQMHRSFVHALLRSGIEFKRKLIFFISIEIDSINPKEKKIAVNTATLVIQYMLELWWFKERNMVNYIMGYRNFMQRITALGRLLNQGLMLQLMYMMQQLNRPISNLIASAVCEGSRPVWAIVSKEEAVASRTNPIPIPSAALIGHCIDIITLASVNLRINIIFLERFCRYLNICRESQRLNYVMLAQAFKELHPNCFSRWMIFLDTLVRHYDQYISKGMICFVVAFCQENLEQIQSQADTLIIIRRTGCALQMPLGVLLAFFFQKIEETALVDQMIRSTNPEVLYGSISARSTVMADPELKDISIELYKVAYQCLTDNVKERQFFLGELLRLVVGSKEELEKEEQANLDGCESSIGERVLYLILEAKVSNDDVVNMMVWYFYPNDLDLLKKIILKLCDHYLLIKEIQTAFRLILPYRRNWETEFNDIISRCFSMNTLPTKVKRAIAFLLAHLDTPAGEKWQEIWEHCNSLVEECRSSASSAHVTGVSMFPQSSSDSGTEVSEDDAVEAIAALSQLPVITRDGRAIVTSKN